jgi:hypothetical protein
VSQMHLKETRKNEPQVILGDLLHRMPVALFPAQSEQCFLLRNDTHLGTVFRSSAGTGWRWTRRQRVAPFDGGTNLPGHSSQTER